MKRRELLFLALLTLGALLVQGYHPGAEDAEIYIPGIKKILHPELYPFGAEFFESHARLTLFPNLIAASVRVTHLPFDLMIFVWQVASIFLFLLSCYRLNSKCFSEPWARWTGVALVAALLTIPVAGTSLYIMDQYLTPRSIVTFALLFAIANTLEKKYVWASAWAAFALMIHPLMAAIGISYIGLLVWMRRFGATPAAAASLSPLGIWVRHPSDAYREVVRTRAHFHLLRWEWYEWLGIFAPLALLWWFGRIARKHRLADLDLLCRTLVVFGLIYFAIAAVITIPASLEGLVRYEPMRSLHLVYQLVFLFGGGLLGKWVLKNRVWGWLLLFVPLCTGMWYVQRSLFPASRHIEWPGLAPKNEWLQAFDWIRRNTPATAVFALDPDHMALPGEDQHGFRAIAERSMLADAVKDSGACTVFPNLPLAEHWRAQVQAQRGWKDFKVGDFERLKREYGVSWVVLERPGVAGLECPYENGTLRVCRVP